MAKDILQCISRSGIPRLMEVLESEFPYSAPVYHWLRVQRSWESKVPGLHVDVMCPEGDWKEGTVVALSSGHMVGGAVHCVIFSRKDERLDEVLRNTRQVPWNDVALFTNVTGSFAPLLKNIIKSKTERPFFEKSCHLFYCSVDDALKIQPPEAAGGVRVSRLTSDHVETVCNLWPYYFPIYRPVIRAMVEHNISVGVFIAREDGGEDLVSMALEADHGGVGLTQTVPEFMGRGLGTLAVANLTRALGEAGTTPHFTVLPDNHVSLGLMRKLGFVKPAAAASHLCFHGALVKK